MNFYEHKYKNRHDEFQICLISYNIERVFTTALLPKSNRLSCAFVRQINCHRQFPRGSYQAKLISLSVDNSN